MTDDENGKRLARAFAAFFESCPFESEFPLGGKTSIPTPSELELLRALEGVYPQVPKAPVQLTAAPNPRKSYQLLIFAIRMAVYSARKRSLSSLKAGILAFLIDDEQADYRDVLVGASIVEDCAKRMEADFYSIVEEAGSTTATGRKGLVLGYIQRQPDMRGLRIMGMEASGHEETLTYQWR